MDPNENIKRQRELAESIIATTDGYDQDREGEGYEEEVLEPVAQFATELAELVLALDEWRRSGGFDPYEQTGVAS